MQTSRHVLEKLVAKEVQRQLKTLPPVLNPVDVYTYALHCLPNFYLARHNQGLDIKGTVEQAIHVIYSSLTERDLNFFVPVEGEDDDDDMPTTPLR